MSHIITLVLGDTWIKIITDGSDSKNLFLAKHFYLTGDAIGWWVFLNFWDEWCNVKIGDIFINDIHGICYGIMLLIKYLIYFHPCIYIVVIIYWHKKGGNILYEEKLYYYRMNNWMSLYNVVVQLFMWPKHICW